VLDWHRQQMIMTRTSTMAQAIDSRVPAVQLVDVSMTYRGAAGKVPVLHDVTVGFPTRSLTAVMGPSGSGKTTLLHAAAGLEPPTSGQVFLGDTRLDAGNDKQLTEIRRNRIGFVFQQFNLLPMLTVYENVSLPLRLGGRPVRRAAVMEVLREVGLQKLAGRRPAQLSGGQQQRAEPTGSLDRATGRQVMELLRQVVDKAGRTVVMVTHDPVAAAYADRVVFLVDGRIIRTVERPSAEQIAAELSRWEA
jgi:putative ABC transport system ATP-binding protein